MQQISKDDAKNTEKMVAEAKAEVSKELTEKYEADKKNLQQEKVQSLMQVENDSQGRVRLLQ